MMGTTKESSKSRNEDEEDGSLPWRYVPHNTRQMLIKKLNPPATVSGNDWRMLANFLGYDTSDINFIESDKDNNTKVLFSQYDTKPDSSFNAVYIALRKMQRQDCLDILNDALPEIKQVYNQAREAQVFHPPETSDVLRSGGHYQWSNPQCACTYSPHPTPACGSHTYCSCGLGFASCPCPAHRHLGHPPYHSHPFPSLPCPNLGQADTTAKTCLPKLNTSPKEQLSCHDRNHQPFPSDYGYRGNSPINRSHNLNHQGQAGMSQGYASYQGPPGYKYESDHMLVESESQSLQYQRFPLMQHNNGSGGVLNDVSGGLPEALQKRQANSNSNLNRTDSSNESFNSRQKMTRQYSDDDSIPDSSTDKRFRNDSGREIAANQQGTAFGGVISHDANGGGNPRSNQSPICAHPSKAVNYMDYRDRHYQQEGIIKVENIQCIVDEKSNDPHPNSSGSSWDRSHPSSTFPMRVKAKQERTLEDLKNLTISKKSTSMPQNMKPAVYRKVFRHVKVFVTYSYDNENHAKQVLSLCRFLQDNGFACCVDVSEKKNYGTPFEQLEWCKRKVIEADFVLVCISNKYLEDIASDRQTLSTNSNEHHLHTREIYELMNSRQLMGQHNSYDNGISTLSPCLIPLLFPGMMQKHIPHCLASGPTYNWPGQYKDLAWILTQPQERMKAKRETNKEGAVGLDRSHFRTDNGPG